MRLIIAIFPAPFSSSELDSYISVERRVGAPESNCNREARGVGDHDSIGDDGHEPAEEQAAAKVDDESSNGECGLEEPAAQCPDGEAGYSTQRAGSRDGQIFQHDLH